MKSEKIANVLTLLARRSANSQVILDRVAKEAQKIPVSILYFAAGALKSGQVLAELFALMSRMRMITVEQALSPENASILLQELELVIERIAIETPSSPFVAKEDFSVPPLGELALSPIGAPSVLTLRDISKGHKGQKDNFENKGQKENADRVSLILSYLRREARRLTIKDIAKEVPSCSEKTIQRELSSLIARGLVRREGDRRWSVYIAS